jgi:multidrug resistance efflux pump
MSEFHPNRVRPLRPRLTVRRVLAFWPALVWLGVVATAVWAYNKGIKFTRMNGLVDPITEAVAADEDSRIERILVRTGTPVKKGDPVVELDTKVLDAQIAKLEAAIRSDLEDRLLNHELDLARLKDSRRRIVRDGESDKGELSAVQAQVARMQAALDKEPNNPSLQAAFSRPLLEARMDEARLLATSPLYEKDLKEIDDDIGRLQKAINTLSEARSEPEKLAAANGDLADLQQLRILRQRTTLLSGHDGVVDRVERDEGEFILKGDTILRIVAKAQVIRVLLPNDQLGQVKVGDTVWASSIVDKYTYFPTTVINLSPRVTNVPNTTSPLPNQVVHGQEIVIAYPNESGFAPGQPVIIHLEEPGKVPLITRLFGGRGRAEQ